MAARNKSLPAHFFARALSGATAERFVIIPPGRCRRAPVREYPKYGRRSTPEPGHKGKHKSQIYNILRIAGQTVALEFRRFRRRMVPGFRDYDERSSFVMTPGGLPMWRRGGATDGANLTI